MLLSRLRVVLHVIFKFDEIIWNSEARNVHVYVWYIAISKKKKKNIYQSIPTKQEQTKNKLRAAKNKIKKIDIWGYRL